MGFSSLKSALSLSERKGYVFTSSRVISSIPQIKTSASAFPFAICVKVFSHSAVSFGLVSTSGRTHTRLLPSFVGISCFPFRSANPALTSFSITAARVAGVPSPRRSASSSVFSLPARSIAESKVSSVWDFGGVVVCSVTLAAGLSKLCPSETVSVETSPSSSSGFCLSVAR